MYRPVGSYETVPESMYQPPWSGTPGWSLAPVPGWGTNPERAGPSVLAMSGNVPARSIVSNWTPVSGDSESAANEGYIALAAAAGIFFGWFAAWTYFRTKKKKG